MRRLRVSLRGRLPLTLPFPCPICRGSVSLVAVIESCGWNMVEVEFECESEPELGSPDWPAWHAGHFAMPYVDWLPWRERALEWLNRNYRHEREP
jgi:hypothetical protein